MIGLKSEVEPHEVVKMVAKQARYGIGHKVDIRLQLRKG